MSFSGLNRKAAARSGRRVKGTMAAKAKGRRCRPWGRHIVAVAGVSALGLSMTLCPSAAAADTALVLGGTGLPNPPKSYVDAVEQLYLAPNGYGSYTPQAFYTPEQGYPLTGVNSMPFDTSIGQGLALLDSAIKQQIAAGNRLVVFGYSQGAVLAAQEMARLEASSNPPAGSQLSFVLVGDETYPNGGIISRFQVPGVPLSLPFGSGFGYAPSASNTYPTSVYLQEYDGFADFPQYPINLLADLNAYIGSFTQHFGYANLTPQQIGSAIPLPTDGSTTTKYYVVPTANLPILDLVRIIPLIGNPLADLLQPDLKILVNLGYGSITDGWSPGPANVVTPFGVLPTGINPVDLVTALANGAVQGVTNAINDLKNPALFDFSSLSLLFSGLHTVGLTASDIPTPGDVLAAFARLGNADVPVSSSGGLVNTVTDLISNDLAVGKPLLDTALGIGVSLVNYNVQLFANQLQKGNLLNAVGMPIAADVALVPYSLLFGAIFPVVEAVARTVTQVAQLVGLQPNPAAATPVSAKAPASTSPISPDLSGAAAKTNAATTAAATTTATTTTGAPARAATPKAATAVTSVPTKPTTPATPPPVTATPTKLTGTAQPPNAVHLDVKAGTPATHHDQKSTATGHLPNAG